MKDENAPIQEFIPADEYQEAEAQETVREYADPTPYSETAEQCREDYDENHELTQIATRGNGVSRIRVPRELNRKRVVNAFNDAFELIGGVPRLAHWADDHPTEFYKLYARLLPSEASQKIQHDGSVTIKHVIPRGPLDE